MTTKQFNESVTDSIKNLVNKAKVPTSFSEWLEQNGDSIRLDDLGGNWTPDRVQANHDHYNEGHPF